MIFFKELAPFFEELAILHFGDMKFSEKEKTKFGIKEFTAPRISLHGWNYIKGLHGIIENYDVVVAGLDPHWINSFALSPFSRKKIVYWGHNLGKGRFSIALRKFFLMRSEAMVTYHEQDTVEVRQIVGKEKARRIFTGNNTLYVSNSQDTSAHPKEYFLYVGRLQSRKELSLVIQEISSLKKRGEHKELLILGDGKEELNRLRKMVQDLDVEDLVSFEEGTVNDERLLEVFSKAIAYVSPGHVGLGVLHSFSYGVPVITLGNRVHAPEHQNIEHGINGLRAEEGKLFEALLVPDKVFREMGHNAYRYYNEKCQIKHMVKGFVDAINV